MKSLFKKLNQTKIFRDLNEQEFSWVLYDVGNSAYTMLACSLIPIWFKDIAIGTAPGQITSDRATAYWALTSSIVTIIVALIGPIFATMTDKKDTKKIFFSTSVAIGVICCVLNGFTHSWLFFFVMYIATKVAYSVSLTFYDSMLNDVTTDERSDVVSSYGYAWGYVGSCIPFLLALLVYICTPSADILPSPFLSNSLGRIIGIIITAVWWLIVTIPLIKNYKQINYVDDKDRTSISNVFKTLGKSFKKIATQDKKVFYFLIAFFLYIDGVGTIIENCINLGTDLGLPKVGQIVFLLLTQIVAWGGSLVFAKLSKKHDTVYLIKICILGYAVVCLYALTLQQLWQFAIMAFGVGCFQGSIQSLSRSYYSRIIPDETSGEYFGIYDIFSKGASFLGSFVLAVIKLIGEKTNNVFNIFGFQIRSINLAVGMLALFFILGYIIIGIADKCPQSEESKKDIQ